MIGKHTAAALRCLLLTICCLGLVTLGTHAQETTVTVEQYGAVGDGVTDDAKAIEAALNSGAEKVVFGAGKTYLYKQRMIMTASGVELDGNGAVLLWDRDTPQETWERTGDRMFRRDLPAVRLPGGSCGERLHPRPEL